MTVGNVTRVSGMMHFSNGALFPLFDCLAVLSLLFLLERVAQTPAIKHFLSQFPSLMFLPCELDPCSFGSPSTCLGCLVLCSFLFNLPLCSSAYCWVSLLFVFLAGVSPSQVSFTTWYSSALRRYLFLLVSSNLILLLFLFFYVVFFLLGVSGGNLILWLSNTPLYSSDMRCLKPRGHLFRGKPFSYRFFLALFFPLFL